MFFGFSAPKKWGVHMKTFSKGSFIRFFPKNGPGGGGAFYQISSDVALTTYPKTGQNSGFWSLLEKGRVRGSPPPYFGCAESKEKRREARRISVNPAFE